MNDFSAEFVQTTQDSSNQRHTYRGLLYLKSGRKMVFDQRTPEPKILYSDGKWSTEYRIERKQAERTPLGKAEDESFQLFQIPWNSEWRKQFRQFAKPGVQPVTAGFRLVEATPNNKDLPVVLFEVDPTTFLIHRFVTTSPDGVLNEFRFTGLKTTKLNDAMFEFKAPVGVEVIDKKGK